VVLHDGWLEAAPSVARRRRLAGKIHGMPNLSLFLRFFNAVAFFAGFQSARISNFTFNFIGGRKRFMGTRLVGGPLTAVRPPPEREICRWTGDSP
jgi:hypothetical protein